MARTGSNRRKTRRRSATSRAQRADRYALYQRSVQSPEFDASFIDRVYRKEYGSPPMLLREDFCGTAAISCAFVASRRGRRAIGIDIDPEPLAWGREHNVAALPEARRGLVRLIEADVRDVMRPRADVVCAMNFSYCVFKTRDELRGYFEAARANLRRKGVLVLDVVGGPETQEEDTEETRTVGRGIRYVWEQKRFDPVSYNARFAIHFLFDDGSALHHAFEYDWRLWTIPEIRELLLEAGFRRADVYWEETDSETGEGNGRYRKVREAEADPAWVACIAAIR
ncbi:MAG: hypothetical protein Kow0062_18600 [Acidobacteriota bacterium]